MVVAKTMSHDEEVDFLAGELIEMSRQVMKLHDAYNINGRATLDLIRRLRVIIGTEPAFRCTNCFLRFYETESGICNNCHMKSVAKV